MVQMALVPERFDRKARVPSGAKVGDQLRPLTASMMSGCCGGCGRAPDFPGGSVSSASRPPARRQMGDIRGCRIDVIGRLAVDRIGGDFAADAAGGGWPARCGNPRPGGRTAADDLAQDPVPCRWPGRWITMASVEAVSARTDKQRFAVRRTLQILHIAREFIGHLAASVRTAPTIQIGRIAMPFNRSANDRDNRGTMCPAARRRR